MSEDLSKSEIRGFKDLEVWRGSMRPVRVCCDVTGFPESEGFGVMSLLHQTELHRSFCNLVRTNSGRYFIGTEP